MSNYRRPKSQGDYFFFTLLTYKRQKLLTSRLARKSLKNAFVATQADHPFKIIAFCILPEHLHCIWYLPTNDKDYSMRWSLIKKIFTRTYLVGGGIELPQSISRQNHRHRGVWHKRFWEHQIRDDRDLQNHINYIHYNPVKHDLVKNVKHWPWSTYHKYISSGYYNAVSLDNLQTNLDSLFINE